MLRNKSKLPNMFVWLILFGLVLVCLVIKISMTFSVRAPGVFDSDYGKELNISFDIFEDGTFIENSYLPYAFSSSIKNKDIELISTLPALDNIGKSFISFRASGYSVRIEIDGNEIYSFYEEGIKDYGGGYWHFIRLPENSDSDQIKIKLFCPTNNPFSHNVFPIYIGSKGYLIQQAFSLSFESIFFGIVLIVFGLLLFGNILVFNRSIGNSFLLSLSLLLMCFGCWVLSQAISKQLIGFTNPVFPMEISFISMFSLPVCLWFYVSTNYDKIGQNKVLKYFAFSIFFLYIPITIISFFGVPYTTFLSFIGSLLVIYSLLLFVISIKLFKKGEKKLISCILAILSLFLSVLAEEILLLLKINIGHVSILHTGMALAAVIFIYQSIGNLIEKNTEANQAKLLKKLAYLDVVTLVGNRNAYERFLEEDSDEIESCGIILADINGLKIINDMFGHKCGDDLLKHMSKSLKDALPLESKLYRVGGDEFIGIIKFILEDDFKIFVEKLQKDFIPSDKDCGMAIGTYFYEKNKGESVKQAIEKADKNMYENKESQKSQIHNNFITNGLSRESTLLRVNK